MVCPKCGLINYDTALRCDCGYDFRSGKVKASYLSGKDLEKQQAKGEKEIATKRIAVRIGLILLGAGLLIAGVGLNQPPIYITGIGLVFLVSVVNSLGFIRSRQKATDKKRRER